MKINYKLNCNRLLKKFTNKINCLLVGRATTALFLAYKVQNKKKRIVIPNIMCLSPYYASLYANRNVIICDVNLRDGTYFEKDLLNILNKNNDISAVLFVHLYGNNSLKTKYYNLCKQKKITIIEDVSQAFGGEFEDHSKFGSKGDISIFSFGLTKNIDAGLGGAILTSNNNTFKKIKKNYKNIVNYENLSAIYKKIYYVINELENKKINITPIRSLLPILFKNMYFRKINNHEASLVYKKLINYKKDILIKKNNFDIYFNNFKNFKKICILHDSKIVSPWRFSFLVSEKKRDHLIKILRNKNIDVSSWYPSLHKMVSIKGKFNNSNIFEKRIINLWVDSNYNKIKIINICKIIKNQLI